MMNRSFWWMAGLLIVSVGFSPVIAQDGENLLDNGGFETGDMTSWGTYGPVTAEVVDVLAGAAVPDVPIEGAYALRLEIATAGANFWDAGLQHTGHVFEQGKHYTLSAFLKMESGEVNINFKPELGQDPWTAYGEQQFTLTEEWTEYSITGPVIGANVDPATITFHIQFAPAVYWIDGVRFYEGDYVPPAFKKRVGATGPSPVESVVDVPRDTDLNWVAGVFANTHDVYFGTSFADVNAASADNPLGVLASQGQSDADFQPVDTLDFSQTYYWRVDEVNAAPDMTVFPGPVWAFTTEAFSDPITPIAVTASSAHSVDMGVDGIIGGAGLDAADQHNIIATDMWLSAATDTAPWVQFEFDKAYRLHEMWVWNSNQGIETVIGFGSQDVTIELSMDGENWTALDGVSPFAQASGASSYTHNTTVDFGEAVAQYVRFSISSGWGPLSQVGLSEVRFYHIPTYAREPQPADGGTTDGVDVTVGWRGGRGATSHEVVMSSDRAQVADNSAVAASVTDSEYAVEGLIYGGTAYWRINEIDEASASIFEGDIWSFMTPEYLSVDDFELYHDEEFFEIWSVWVDGFGDEANNGAIVGNVNEAERGVVQEGSQSMPLHYDNSTAAVSSATRTFDTPQDWTLGSPEMLSAHFRGNAPDFIEDADGSITIGAAGADIWGASDEFRFVYKRLSGNGSIAARVDSLVVTHDWAKAGVMIRESLAPESANAAVLQSGVNGVHMQARPSTFANSTDDNAANATDATQNTLSGAPVWIRLDRSGDEFNGYYATDEAGTDWVAMGWNPQSIPMGSNVYIGLAVTSHEAGVTTAAEFSEASTTGAVTGAWIPEIIGGDHPSNDAAPIYMVVADSSGQEAVVIHPDAAATITTNWTAWETPLSDLGAINLSRVSSVTFGVGVPGASQASGAQGTLFIDNLRIGTARQAPETSGPSGPTEPSAGNLLSNGDIETGDATGWNVYGDATLEAVQDPVSEGAYALRVEVNSAGANFWDAGLQHQGHVFEEGKSYTVSAFMKAEQGEFQLNFKPERGASPWEAYGEQQFTLTEEWIEYSVETGVIPAEVTPATITWHIGFAPGVFFIDGVRFYEGSYVSADPAPANLLDNGDIETGDATGWNVYGDATLEAVQDPVVEGAYSLRVEVNSAGANFWDAGLQHQGHVFEEGKSYTVSAFMKAEQGEFQVNFKPERGASPWEAYGEQQFTLTEEWVEYSVATGVIPAEVTPATITWHIAFEAGVFFIDDVQFYEAKLE